MKRTIYIFSFTVLGLLFAVLVDSLLEIYLLRHNYNLKNAELFQYQSFIQILLLTGCGVWGYQSGKYWWYQLYELKKYDKRWFRSYKWL